ncbi:MAG: Trk system potassium transporter TrkA [Bacteroidales bacterium]|nr:Trk system potassium transporter TrkA [Bacteroidales bacterium]
MKIVIGGAGAVGTHLALLLSKEKQDIVLIDEDLEHLRKLGSNFDIMVLNASPSSIDAQKKAGVANADLFVGVTPDESKNMACCMIASNLGCKKTVARIDNYEYLAPKNAEFFRHLGINTLVYPEMLAAREISNAVRNTWIRQWWEVGSGDLVMIGVKMRKGSTILNTPLKNLGGSELPYHIVAIKRGDETIIPNGNDQILELDLVYFMANKKDLPEIRRVCGKEQYPEIKKILIMGGGRIAVRTMDLIPNHVQVTIIEKDEKRCQKLTELLAKKNNVLIVHGDGRNLDMLEEVNIQKVQAFIALTGSAETNVLACLSALKSGVVKTVAQVENTEYMKMAEDLDIGTIINKKNIAAGSIYQRLLAADVTNMKTLELANADVAELTVGPDAKITQKMVKDLGLPKGIAIGGLVRNGVGMHVQGNTRIQEGDHVVIFCMSDMIKSLEKYF